ncbi:hypothetical protein ACH5RR_012801 [Cinchona calisaya]|uniref:RNase H type-1 domain-containing protein n=1 Tax=Cinchona calisaya TaxID=153742 RepID=A0ABD3AC72_9GENT
METEALALLFGIQLCIDKSLLNVFIEKDSLILSKMIQGHIPTFWKLDTLLHKVKYLLSMGHFQLRHVLREANIVVYKLAKMANASQDMHLFFVSITPTPIHRLVRLDYMRTLKTL